MSELGLQTVLTRIERLDASVGENVERVADHVIKLDTKVDTLVEGQARLEGTLESHISSEETWRREVSEKINAVDYQARANSKEAKDEAVKVATEAKVLAEQATQAKNDWGVRWQTIVAMVAFLGVVIGILVGYAKLIEAPAKAQNNLSTPASPAHP